MRGTSTSKTALAVFLAALFFCSSIVIPTAKAEEDFPARTVNLLILYDQSYEAYFDENCSITDPAHRLEQVMKLAKVPFKETLNITLNITVLSYQNTIGPSYAMLCPDIYPLDNPMYLRDHHHWEYDEHCGCAGLNDHNGNYHHDNISKLRMDASAYRYAHSNDYDAVGVYCAFDGYMLHDEVYKDVYGCGALGGHSFAIEGNHSIANSTFELFNVTNCAGMLWHEFGHNFGLRNGSNDFTNNNPDNCTENYPCTMSGGFGSVIYLPNGWCTNCLYKLSENGGGLAGHFD